MSDIVAGVVVRVSQSGPPMTVESVKGDQVATVWFEGDTLCRDIFDIRELVKDRS